MKFRRGLTRSMPLRRPLLMAMLLLVPALGSVAGSSDPAVRTVVVQPDAASDWMFAELVTKPTDYGYVYGWWCRALILTLDVPDNETVYYLDVAEVWDDRLEFYVPHLGVGDAGAGMVSCSSSKPTRDVTTVVVAAADAPGMRLIAEFQPGNTAEWRDIDVSNAPHEAPRQEGTGSQLSLLFSSARTGTLIARNVHHEQTSDVAAAGIEQGTLLHAGFAHQVDGPVLQGGWGSYGPRVGAGEFDLETAFGGEETQRSEFLVSPVNSAGYTFLDTTRDDFRVDLTARLTAGVMPTLFLSGASVPVDLASMGYVLGQAVRREGHPVAPIVHVGPDCLQLQEGAWHPVSCIVGG